MAKSDPIIVVGAGQCGLKATETFRQLGYDGDLLLIGDEPSAPYQRPPLSKAFLKGELNQERLSLAGPDYFDNHNVETRFGDKVSSLDVQANVAVLSDGTRLPYSKLLLATGSRARTIPMPGIDLPGVCLLRTLEDTKRLAGAIGTDRRIVIVGGGYIGLEVAASARALGHNVTVLEGADRVLQRVVCPEISQFFEDLHQRHGVDVRTGVRPTRILGEAQVSGIELAGGETINCDVVLVAVGGMADERIAQASGLATNNGVRVDEACRTSATNVFAAGDCALFPSKKYDRLIRLESVQNAIDQGKAAAQAMLGEEVRYDPVPWFWSDQYDVKLQIAGLSQGYDRVDVADGKTSNSFAVTYVKNDRTICVDAVNNPRAHMMARRDLATSAY